MASEPPRAALFGQACNHVYRGERLSRLNGLVELHPGIVDEDNLLAQLPELQGTEMIFASWGMPVLGETVLDSLPSLRALFYAAGSVKDFARPLLERGIVVVSAASANAQPVAAFVLAQTLLSLKGYFHNTREIASPSSYRVDIRQLGRGIFEQPVALLGAGHVGRALIGHLRRFPLEILVVDPNLTEQEARDLGVRRVELLEAFEQARVVSNHLPDLPDLKGVLRREHFSCMRRGATFINTGRGAQVVQQDLIAVLEERPDLMALLDVSDPEPPTEGSRLYTLDNVQLSSHIAGSIHNEVLAMADLVIDEFQRFVAGQPLQHAVTLQQLDWQA